MNSIFIIINIYLFVAVVLSMYFLAYALNRKQSYISKTFVFLSISVLIYLFGYLMELNSITLERMVFWNRIQYFGIPFIPGLWLMLAVKYSKHERLLNSKTLLLIFIIPAFTFFIRNFNHYVHWFYTNMVYVDDRIIPILYLEKGIWYMVHAAYVSICLGISNYLYIISYKKSDKDDKTVSLYLITASFFPWISIFLNLKNYYSYGIDFVALIFPISLFMLSFIITEDKLFKLKPLAMDKVFVDSNEGIIVLDAQRNLVDFNPTASAAILELKKDLFEESIESILHRYMDVDKFMENGSETEFEIEYNGDIRYYNMIKSNLYDASKQDIGFIITIIDITRKTKTIKRLEQNQKRIEYLSFHDQLTGLYNRRFYEEKLLRVDARKSLPLAVIMADVNGLKLVNDAFGHASGDRLLKKAAEVIEERCRANDIVIRLGGDEFIILMPRTKEEEVKTIVERIKESSTGVKVNSVGFSFSIGWEIKRNEKDNIHDIIRKAEDHMYRDKLMESPYMKHKMINDIIGVIHEKNPWEKQHSIRVGKLCEAMGAAVGLTNSEIKELKNAGMFHDIGKIAIDEAVLNKPGSMGDDEFSEITRHSEIGYRILSTVNDMSDMAEYVLAHHERWDGKGYPKGLMGVEIPIQARIISVADAYDAMTSDRVYAKALSHEQALKELGKNAGTQFDPMLVRILVEQVLSAS